MTESVSMEFRLGAYQADVDAALAEMIAARVMDRIWEGDHTVWKPVPDEITSRLGWLHVARDMVWHLPDLQRLVADVRSDGYTDVLLLGMGGSSLASEVFRDSFGVRDGYLDLKVLDSTDPGAVLDHARRLDLARTLFVVATKSGGTVETLSFFKCFYNQVAGVVGNRGAGAHFVAITDPGTALVDLASRYGFRATHINDPNIGGRYSALSHFGLVPASLIGVDVPRLLRRAQAMADASGSDTGAQANPGARLGAALGELARGGRDKASFILSPAIAGFGDWVEQLIAESTGKDGKGIVPVVGESVGLPGAYGRDRAFIHVRLDADAAYDRAVATLEESGHPVIRLNLHDPYDLGGQIFLWELAVAVAGHRLGINPFDQPNVETAKVQARRFVAAYASSGTLPPSESAPLATGTLRDFLAQAVPGDYVALQAYVQPTMPTNRALARLRRHVRDRTRLATTVGYGPRFLHSTGQLHKGDAGNGLFIQLTAGDAQDVPIPDIAGETGSSISFGVLKAAQALGDYRALLDAGRRVIRFDLGEDVLGGLATLTDDAV